MDDVVLFLTQTQFLTYNCKGRSDLTWKFLSVARTYQLVNFLLALNKDNENEALKKIDV